MSGFLRDKRAWETVQAFLGVLDARHKATAAHSLRVSVLALAVGRAMRLPGRQLAELYAGTLIHDIGKLAIPDEVLDKPGALLPEEWAQVREHPLTGRSLIGDGRRLGAVGGIVLGHHERYDGGGYPLGLRGDAIPPLARVCAVADALDAMLFERPYRERVALPHALAELERCRGTQFDPAVVAALDAVRWAEALDAARDAASPGAVFRL